MLRSWRSDSVSGRYLWVLTSAGTGSRTGRGRHSSGCRVGGRCSSRLGLDSTCRLICAGSPWATTGWTVSGGIGGELRAGIAGRDGTIWLLAMYRLHELGAEPLEVLQTYRVPKYGWDLLPMFDGTRLAGGMTVLAPDPGSAERPTGGRSPLTGPRALGLGERWMLRRTLGQLAGGHQALTRDALRAFIVRSSASSQASRAAAS